MDLQVDKGRGSKYSRMLDDYGNEGEIVEMEQQEIGDMNQQLATVKATNYSVEQKRVFI